jgi:hypothetical protein
MDTGGDGIAGGAGDGVAIMAAEARAAADGVVLGNGLLSKLLLINLLSAVFIALLVALFFTGLSLVVALALFAKNWS